MSELDTPMQQFKNLMNKNQNRQKIIKFKPTAVYSVNLKNNNI